MPQVNGKHYRSFGQGYAAEKGKQASDRPEAKDAKTSEDGKEGKGSTVQVKHMGGGKFKVKHADGSVTDHESAEDMHSHLDEHFGIHDSEGHEGEPAEEYGDESGGMGLESILG